MKPRRRWPQISLKGLLIVVTLAALIMPWSLTAYRDWRARLELDKWKRLTNPRARARALAQDARKKRQGAAPVPMFHFRP